MSRQELFLLPRTAKSRQAEPVVWAYPNTYDIGMAGLGYQLVFWLLDQNPDFLVHRAFADYQEPGCRDAALIGFTLSWELDYANILQMLERFGVAMLASERDDGEPLVFGGGPVLAANPEPFADFFDVLLLGDAEELVPKLLDAWSRLKDKPSRQDKLLALAQIPGMYVPSFYKPVYDGEGGDLLATEAVLPVVPAAIVRQPYTPPADYVAHSVVLTPESSWGNMFLVEVVRSCPQECRFCLASFLSRPFRAAPVETLLEKIDLGLKHTPRIGLLGPSVTEHPQFALLAEGLLERPQTEISIASIRADTIEAGVLEMLVRLGQRSVTIALESGSERLRSIMKKNLTETEFLHAMELIAASGLKAVKLYGIVGLPGETAHDLEETVRLLKLVKKKHKQLRITFGVSSFVPKAQTPFQWAGRDRQCQKKIEYVRKHLSACGIEVRPESHNWSDIQALLSRADRRLTPVLLAVAGNASQLGPWRRALKQRPAGCPDLDYFAYRQIEEEAVLPWSHLTDDARAGMLKRHKEAADKLTTVGL